MSQLPTDIANESLDAAGINFTLGDLEEGTRQAQVCLRKYDQCLRRLLRTANWDFARKSEPLTLLADATGNTTGVGTVVPSGYTYEYLYPTDCMKMRFIPWNQQTQSAIPPGNIAVPAGINIMPGLNNVAQNSRVVPARWVIATDPNYATAPGGQWWLVQGASPTGNTVILTDVQNAVATYTAYMPYPSTWDSLFRAAMVAYLASEIALPLADNKALGRQLRNDQITIAKQKIEEARIVDGNEGAASSDIRVDWMDGRMTGGWYDGHWRGGGYGHNFDSCHFSDGTAF